MRFAHFEFDPARDRLGEGPQSEVFRAVDTTLGRSVALKILRPHVEFDPAAKERFEREAKHTSLLAHPHIATIFEYGQDRGTSYIAMEFLEGRTLDKVLKDGKPLDIDEGMRVALKVASALALVHERGIVHRDLKPANVMVTTDGNVKLLDFGICRSRDESTITQEGMLVGTVLYMSPEQVLGEDLDARSDVFAFGSVFYHALTGELPFPGKSFPEVCMSVLEADPRKPSVLRSGFSEDLEAFLLKCLARDPAKRFKSAGELNGVLNTIAEKLKLSTSGDRPATVVGRIQILPLALSETSAHAKAFAGALRQDLKTELGRSTQLEVLLPEGGEAAKQARESFLLRGKLDVARGRATVEYTLERASHNGKHDSTAFWRETIELADEDEWSLQAKLVGTLARAVKKRLAEYTLAPPPEERRDPAQARELARRAHDILHRGTTRHLMAAVSSFRRAIEADPSCALAHAGMAEALAWKFMLWDGDPTFLQEARESARRALAHAPYCAEAHTSLGFAHMLSGDAAEAQREYRLAIQIDHEEWLAHRLLGALLGRLGNFEGASPLLVRATALKPTHIGSFDHLHGVLLKLDRYQEAIGVADKGIALAKKHLREAPDDQEARLSLALLLARMGQTDEARATIELARKQAPKDGYTNYHVARVYALLGEPEAALALLKEAQLRGFHLQSDAQRNADLEILRGRPEFQALMG